MLYISIHAPREGSDALEAVLTGRCPISIHAPREGSDLVHAGLHNGDPIDFYPRSPRGERHMVKPPHLPACAFLSTLPARGATAGSPGLSG